MGGFLLFEEERERERERGRSRRRRIAFLWVDTIIASALRQETTNDHLSFL